MRPWRRSTRDEEPRAGAARGEPRHARDASGRRVRGRVASGARAPGTGLRARARPRGELLADEPRGGVLRDAPPSGRERRWPDPELRRVDPLLVRDPRRARGGRPAGGGGAHLGHRVARGLAPGVGGPRPVHRARAGQGSRGLPRGARAAARLALRMSSARADRLLPLLEQRELDCLLVTDSVNVRWLCGFTGTNSAAIVAAEERLFFTDFRYVEQADAQVAGFERVVAERDLLDDLASRLRGRVGFDDAELSVRAHAKLGEAVSDEVELVAAGGL